MKKYLVIAIAVTLSVCIAVILISYPKLSNMKSEYASAKAITDLSNYVKENKRWPSSYDELYPNGDPNIGVFIDFDVSLKDLVNDPSLIKQSVKPESGKFYTYPHYEDDLEKLLNVIHKHSE